MPIAWSTRRPAPGDVLHQRLRALRVGRHRLSAARRPRFLQERRACIAGAAPRHPQAPCRHRHQRQPIVERYYQHRAIRRSAETFESHRQRRALLVMATGAGKTRTVIALADLLMRANWAKRILFLADRTALVRQAVNAFKAHLPAAAPVNLLTDKATEGRIYVSTYPTMMGLIEEMQDGPQRRFGLGHFDLDRHRRGTPLIYRKYGAIFDYFDSPARRPDRHAEGRNRPQHLQPVPARRRRADRRLLAEEAVNDGYLVPMRPSPFRSSSSATASAITLYREDEKETWDAAEWDEDGAGRPSEWTRRRVNNWLFNADTVDR